MSVTVPKDWVEVEAEHFMDLMLVENYRVTSMGDLDFYCVGQNKRLGCCEVLSSPRKYFINPEHFKRKQ